MNLKKSLLIGVIAISSLFCLKQAHAQIILEPIPEYSQTVSLVRGFNSFSPYIDLQMTAASFCKVYLPKESSILVFNEATQQYTHYTCATGEGEDFPMVAHDGYLINSPEATTLELRGEEVEQKYSFVLGNNFLGLSFADTGEWDAHEICGPLGDTPGWEVSQVSWWDSLRGTWSGHPCGTPINKFHRIKKGEAYMLQVRPAQTSVVNKSRSR